MFRNIMNDLATWYEIGENKAALIRGGKFVGKTWAALDFATGFFDEHILQSGAVSGFLPVYFKGAKA